MQNTRSQVLRINNQPSIIYKSSRKLLWLSLPQLTPIYKYYTKSNYIKAMSMGSLLVIDKNCINFLTVNLPPLALNVFKQQFMNWEPTGGLCLSNILILYDKHTINFYERSQNLKKTWTIEVMQFITQICASPMEKTIGMRVKQKTDTIFLWNLHDISNKPFQQVTVSSDIIKWQFYDKDMLVILTSKQLQVYYPEDGHYNSQFFIQIAHFAIDFCFLDRPKTNEHSGRRTVYPVAVLSPCGKLYIYQLYDMDKRIKTSIANIIATLELQQNTSAIICGYEKENEIILCAQLENGKPFCMTLNPQFVPKKKWLFLPQLNTANPKLIQYCKQIICTQDMVASQENQSVKVYKLYKIIGKQQFEFIEEYECINYAILGGYNFFKFQKQQIIVYPKSQNFAINKNITIQNVKVPSNLTLLEEKNNVAFFIAGIKIYRLDINNKIFKAAGFVIKNQKCKLVEVRNQTRSILYELNGQYMLMEYQTPENPENQNQKLVIKTIKSSTNNVISLRNNRWALLKLDRIVIGEGVKILVEFDLAKFFKLLTLQNTLLDYKIYWTTHDGMLLVIKNYIFILQLIESTDGYAINPIKRSLTFLHCRLDPDVGEIQIMDARSIVVRQGSRVMRLGSKLGNYISEDPYSLPDTVLRRQLLMRKMYPPHHPKIVQYLIQLGYFGLLRKLADNVWDWLQEKGTMLQLYDKIGLQFYLNNKANMLQEKPTQYMKQFSNQLQESQQPQSTMKKLCDFILQNPHSLNLQQNGSLILQSQIQALIFKQQNSRSVDAYSSVILTQFKTFETKNQNFKTMHIAYMIHSINKQQAVGILRQQKTEIDWDWMKKYSIVMWYDVKSQIKTWAQEIGANLFKTNKEPMDCLFWYTIAGKKTVLIQLFKKYTFNSAQHDAIFKFLQRDFAEPKNQNAAVKNAYVLIDKKRYLHALAFFIYGQKIDEAISLCLSKLKDLNLAFLLCNLTDDNKSRQKLIETLLNEGDVWCKHIGYFYKNQHVDSFNCLFQQENIQTLNNWQLQPKLTSFHPCLKQFAQMIQKSIPVKRELQQQMMKKNQPDPNDIFDSFFGSQEETKEEEQTAQQKRLQSNYDYITKESVRYFVRNNCPTLALMLDQNNHRAKRAYDLCKFMLTKEVNSTVLELIEDMQDYESTINSKLKEKVTIKPVLLEFTNKYKQTLEAFTFSAISVAEKSKIGELMHFSYLAERFVNKIQRKEITDQECLMYTNKYIVSLLVISKMLLILKMEIYDKIQDFANQFLGYILEGKLNGLNQEQQQRFWEEIKAHYDKIPQPKKNKKQSLYDTFEQSLYKLTFKKTQFTQQNTTFKLSIQNCIHIYLAKLSLDIAIRLLNQNSNNINLDAVNILERMERKISSVLNKWSQEKTQEQLQRQCTTMLNEGVVSKLKLHFLPNYLQNNFEALCRGLIAMKAKIKKIYSERDGGKSSNKQKIGKGQVIQVFRNKQDGPRAFAINKNDGFGMEVAMLTKRGVKKLQICESLVNRNRSQDGISLVHEDAYYNMENQFNFSTMFETAHPPLVEKFIRGVVQNRKQYDGIGIIKGSTKRTTPQYLKAIDPIPFLQFNEVNCIECHHFLPIYMLGGKSSIQLCTFSANKNYNRIKCPSLGDIVKIRSYEQRVAALDNNGNLSCYSFDSKISGTCVYSLKKAGVVDFCEMTPTTYGICTSSSIQVIDTLMHPKRQVVFKTSTNQAPTAIDYYNRTKLAVCRRSDLLVYDIRMDIQEENRDIGGKAKCMITNFKNRILVGKMDNRVRVMDMSGTGSDSDYDIKCISGFRGMNEPVIDKATVDDIQIMGNLAIALNSEGIMTMFSIQ